MKLKYSVFAATLSVAFLRAITVEAKPTSGTNAKVSSALRFVVDDVLARRKNALSQPAWSLPQWKSASYFGVTCGRKEYVYNWRGQLIATQSAAWPAAGLMGTTYAETGWQLLNGKMRKLSDLGGSQILHWQNRRWYLVAWDDSAQGYGNRLDTAKIPPHIQKQRQRWISN